MGTATYDAESWAWWFGFEGRGGIQLFCPWNIVADGKFALASGDHAQRYGLPAPVDAAADASRLLAGRRVEERRVNPATADLQILLDGGVEIRTLSDSTGYEMWVLRSPDHQMFVGQGGGVSSVRWDGNVGYGERLE